MSRTERVLGSLSFACIALSVVVKPLSIVFLPMGLLFGVVTAHMTCKRLRLRLPVELGCVIIPGMAVLAVVLFPIFVHERVLGLHHVCMGNLKELTMATERYMQKHDRRFPPAEGWNEALRDALTRAEDPSVDVDRSLVCP